VIIVDVCGFRVHPGSRHGIVVTSVLRTKHNSQAATLVDHMMSSAPRPNGVLSIPASATQRRAGGPINMSSRAATLRLKVIVRRLPPGLSQTEFDTALGDDWKIHGGKVDWAIYKPGKISKE